MAGFRTFLEWSHEFELDAIGIIFELLGSQRSDISSPTKESASNTPLSALLTDAEVQAFFASPSVTPARGRLTPRQLF